MAIFNRSKEKWDPKKPLNKTTKNRTVHFQRDSSSSVSPKEFSMNSRLWFYLDAVSQDSTDVYNFVNLNATHNGYVSTSSLKHEGTDPSIDDITAVRFDHQAIRFGYDGNQGFVQSGSHVGELAEILFTKNSSNEYKAVNSAFWMSFWYKSPDRYPGSGNKGQSIGGFLRNDPADNSTPNSASPSLGIYITSTGKVSVRMHTANTDGSDVTPRIDTDISFVERLSSRSTKDNDWNLISICMPVTAGAVSNLNTISIKDFVGSSRIWINGTEDINCSTNSFGDFHATDAGLGSNHWLALGNSNAFWSTTDTDPLDASEYIVNAGIGFEGWIGQFIVMNYHSTDLNSTAKFLYEAFREGVFGVHSGTHNSEPLREIKEQRRIRYYPPNNGGSDQHLLTTENRNMFEEGRSMLYNSGTSLYDTPETFNYDASKFYKQSNIIMPHLQTNPSDEVLQHWLAEDRSVFFSEDLQSPSSGGFTVEHTGISTSDVLYKDTKQEQTVGPYNDYIRDEQNTEFKDAFFIDIPIGHGGSAQCVLSTDSVGEVPLIDGNSATVDYSGFWIGDQTVFYPDAGYVKLDWLANDTLDLDVTAPYNTPPRYWVEVIDTVPDPDVTYDKWQFYNYTSEPTTDASPDTVPTITPSEYEAWLGLISYLKHVLLVYHWPAIKSEVAGGATHQEAWWNIFVKPSGTYKNIYQYNPYHTNVVSSIMAIDTGDFGEVYTRQAKYVPSTAAAERKVFAAIHLLKGLGGIRLNNTSTLLYPNRSTPHQVSALRISEATYHDMGVYVHPSINGASVIGTFVMLPSIATVKSWGLEVNYEISSLVDEYTTSSASTFWSPSKYPIHTDDSSGNPWINQDLLSGGSLAVQDPAIGITTMAYHNFSSGEWEEKPAFSTTHATQIDPTRFVENASIGFSPMSSLVYPFEVGKLEEVVDSAGRPTDSFGFPFHSKYDAAENQTLNLSEYISEPVILKGWELKMDVIPQSSPTPSNIFDEATSGYEYSGIRGLMGSNVIASGNYSSPYLFGQYENGSNKLQFGNSFPTGAKTLGSISQVTKGVTAFLMRQVDFVESNLSLDMYTSNPHQYTFYSNHYNAYQPQTTKQAELKSVHEFSIGPNSIGNSTIFQQGAHKAGFFTNSKTKELLGYMQHVYHNDDQWATESNYKVRFAQAGLLDLGSIPANQKVNFNSVFNRESSTYIQSLHANTATVDFHVTGSIKSNSKMTNSSVISPFFVRSNIDITGANENMFFNPDQAHNDDTQNFVTNFSILNNWSGGSGVGDITDGSNAKGVVGQELGDVVQTPRFAVPMSGSAGTANRKIDHLSQKMSINPESKSEVILYPHDKLVLGIQDSVSTIIGSQMIDDQGNLVKWGRNSLKIPHQQQGSYIRLFLERQRKGIGYSPRSNQSHGFSEDVNEALGNVVISDQYETAPLRMYSGSISDDIMAPQPLNPASAMIRVQHSQFQGGAVTNFDPTSAVIPSFSHTEARNYVGTQSSPPYPAIRYNWIFLNELIFKDRTPDSHTSHTTGSPCFYKKPNFKEVMATGNTHAQPNEIYATYGSLQVGMWPVTTSSARINPMPTSTNQHLNTRYGGCCALWELNRNPARVVPSSNANKMTIDNDGNDFSFSPTAENPAFSSWKFKALFPLFSQSSTSLKWRSLLLTGRLISLDRDNIPQAYEPRGGGSWESLQPGDIFFFSSTASDVTRGSHPVLIWNTSAGAGDEFTGVSWSEHAYASGSDLLADIYIVAAQGHVDSGFEIGSIVIFNGFQTAGSFNPWDTASGVAPITWNTMMASIKGILKSEIIGASGLNYTITENYTDTDWFQIEYIKDDFAIDRLVDKQTTFNSLLEFSLLDTSGDLSTGDHPDSKIWAYRDENFTQNQGFDSGTITNYGFNQFQKESQSGSTYTVSTVDNTAAATTDRMMTDTYLRQHSDRSGGSANPTGNSGDHDHSSFNITIDYSNLPKRTAVSIEIKTAQTPAAISGYDINKKVAFRTTEGNAGPFGSLNKFQKLFNDQSVQSGDFVDSYPRNIFNNLSSYWKNINNDVLIDLTTQVPTNWLFNVYPSDAVEEFDSAIKKVTIPGTADGANSILSLPLADGASTRDDASLLLVDELGNTVTFTLDDLNVADIEIKDHIREEFPSLANVQKTLGDIAGGFGQGLQGRLVFRPSVFKYVTFDNNNSADRLGDPAHFFMKIDPIRGARFGLFNTRKQSRSFVFSRSSYGQCKDMMEQSLDSSYVLDSTNLNHDPINGAPILYSSKNPNDPRIEVELGDNNRRNKDKFQRVYYPVFDRVGDNIHDYGVTVPSGSQIQSNLPTFTQGSGTQTVNTETGEEYDSTGSAVASSKTNQNLVVGLPGVISSRSAVSPGSIRSSIRDDD